MNHLCMDHCDMFKLMHQYRKVSCFDKNCDSMPTACNMACFRLQKAKLEMIITRHRFHVPNRSSQLMYHLQRHDMWWKILVVIRKIMSVMQAVEKIQLQGTL